MQKKNPEGRPRQTILELYKQANNIELYQPKIISGTEGTLRQKIS